MTKRFDECYSNFDCVKPKGAEEALKGGMYMNHPAMDHWGKMYYQDGKFKEDVFVRGNHVETMEADTLEELFNNVNAEYGAQ